MGVINIKKEIAIGFLISVFATFCGLFIYTQYISTGNFIETLEKIKQGGVLGTALALAALPNLFVFFIFLKKNQEYRSRGVLLGVIAVAFVTFVLRIAY